MVPVLGITQQKLMRFSTCMDKSCCCNSSAFSLFLDDSNTTKFTGVGTQQNPIKSNVKISADAGNILQVRQDGLFAPASEGSALVTADTTSVNLSGNGQAGTPLTADVIISPDAGNIVQSTANGIYATIPNTCINSVTYAELILLMFGDGEEGSGGDLQPGCLYLISDYQSIGSILRLEYDGNTISKTDSGQTYTGQIDPILIRAVDGFTLEPWGTTSNGDEVEYDVFAGEKGGIRRRINKSLKIDLPLDWYAVQYIYDNTAAGGSINTTFNVFNGTDDHGASNFTRATNGLYIGRDTYGNTPVIIFGASTGAIHMNVMAHTGPYFICNTANNISKGAFSYMDITADLAGDNDYSFNAIENGVWTPTILSGVGNTDYSINGSTNTIYTKIGNVVVLSGQITFQRTSTTSSGNNVYIDASSLPFSVLVPTGGIFSFSNPSSVITTVVYHNGGLDFTSSLFGSMALGGQTSAWFTFTYIAS